MPQTVETIKFVRVDGTRTSNLDEPLEIRSKQHAMLEAAREDVRLFAMFLDDYHIDKRPDITLPLRDTLTKFIKQLGPNDLVVLMEPLTTLYDLKYTRAKDELLQRIRTFEGRRGQAFPVKSAIEEAQLTQRNWLELRAGVTLVGARGAGHADGRACGKAASRSCSSARGRRCRRAAPTNSAIAPPWRRPIAATSPST